MKLGATTLTSGDSESDEEDEDDKPKPNGFDSNVPVVVDTQPNLKDLQEYGYGFWARFLTAYPQRLLSGKNAPWYFVARLTKNEKYDNVGMGDR